MLISCSLMSASRSREKYEQPFSGPSFWGPSKQGRLPNGSRGPPAPLPSTGPGICPLSLSPSYSSLLSVGTARKTLDSREWRAQPGPGHSRTGRKAANLPGKPGWHSVPVALHSCLRHTDTTLPPFLSPSLLSFHSLVHPSTCLVIHLTIHPPNRPPIH